MAPRARAPSGYKPGAQGFRNRGFQDVRRPCSDEPCATASVLGSGRGRTPRLNAIISSHLVFAEFNVRGRGGHDSMTHRRFSLMSTMAPHRPPHRPDLKLMTAPEVSERICSRGATSCRPRRFLTWDEVRGRVRLSRSTVWRLERAGQFPPRIRISPGRVGWLENDIDDFILGHWKPRTPAP